MSGPDFCHIRHVRGDAFRWYLVTPWYLATDRPEAVSWGNRWHAAKFTRLQARIVREALRKRGLKVRVVNVRVTVKEPSS